MKQIDLTFSIQKRLPCVIFTNNFPFKKKHLLAIEHYPAIAFLATFNNSLTRFMIRSKSNKSSYLFCKYEPFTYEHFYLKINLLTFAHILSDIFLCFTNKIFSYFHTLSCIYGRFCGFWFSFVLYMLSRGDEKKILTNKQAAQSVGQQKSKFIRNFDLDLDVDSDNQ